MSQESVFQRWTPEQELDYLVAVAQNLAETANKGYEGTRKVAVGAAAEIAERVFDERYEKPFSVKKHYVISEVSHFIELSQKNKVITASAKHTDLLPIAHPRSTQHHSIPQEFVRTLKARWFADDPRFADPIIQPLVASALNSDPESAEHQYALTRLDQMNVIVPLQALVAVAGGPGANNWFWLTQLRDSEGKWAKMYGGMTFNVTREDGKTYSFAGTVIGATSNRKGKFFVVENRSGLFLVPEGKGKSVPALLPSKMTPTGFSARPVRVGADDPVISESEIQKIKYPPGFKKNTKWRPDPAEVEYYGTRADLGEMVTDGSYNIRVFNRAGDSWLARDDFSVARQREAEGQDVVAVGAGPNGEIDLDKPVFFVSRNDDKGNRVFAAVQSWADAMAFMQQDNDRYKEGKLPSPERNPKFKDPNKEVEAGREPSNAPIRKGQPRNDERPARTPRGPRAPKATPAQPQEAPATKKPTLKSAEPGAKIRESLNEDGTEFNEWTKQEDGTWELTESKTDFQGQSVDSDELEKRILGSRFAQEDFGKNFSPEEGEPQAPAPEAPQGDRIEVSTSDNRSTKTGRTGTIDAKDLDRFNELEAERERLWSLYEKETDRTVKQGILNSYGKATDQLNELIQPSEQAPAQEQKAETPKRPRRAIRKAPAGPTEGQTSPDFTDDPVELAQKFTREQLVQALNKAVEDDSDFASLPFADGDEPVPVESLFQAVRMSRRPTTAQPAQAPKPARTRRPRAAKPASEELPSTPGDQREALDKRIEELRESGDITEDEEGRLVANTPEAQDILDQSDELDAFENQDEGLTISRDDLPAALQALSDEELQDYLETGDYRPYLTSNEPIENAPEGYHNPDPAPFSGEGAPAEAMPDKLAVDFSREELEAALRESITNGEGYALLDVENEVGEKVSMRIPTEALRDALKLQGNDPAELINSIMDEGRPQTEGEGEGGSVQATDANPKPPTLGYLWKAGVAYLRGRIGNIAETNPAFREFIERAGFKENKDLGKFTARMSFPEFVEFMQQVQKNFNVNVAPERGQEAIDFNNPPSTDAPRPASEKGMLIPESLLENYQGMVIRRGELLAQLAELNKDPETNAQRIQNVTATLNNINKLLDLYRGVDDGEGPRQMDVMVYNFQPGDVIAGSGFVITGVSAESEFDEKKKKRVRVLTGYYPGGQEQTKRWGETLNIPIVRGVTPPEKGDIPPLEKPNAENYIDAPADQKRKFMVPFDNYKDLGERVWAPKDPDRQKQFFMDYDAYVENVKRAKEQWLEALKGTELETKEASTPSAIPTPRTVETVSMQDVQPGDVIYTTDADGNVEAFVVESVKPKKAPVITRLIRRVFTRPAAEGQTETDPQAKQYLDDIREKFPQIDSSDLDERMAALQMSLEGEIQDGNAMFNDDGDIIEGEKAKWIIAQMMNLSQGLDIDLGGQPGPEEQEEIEELQIPLGVDKVEITGYYPGYASQKTVRKASSSTTVIRGEQNLPQKGKEKLVKSPDPRDPDYMEKRDARQAAINEASKQYGLSPEDYEQTKKYTPRKPRNSERGIRPAFQGRIAEIIESEEITNGAQLKERLKKERVVYFDFETVGTGDFDNDNPDAPVALAAKIYENGELVETVRLYMNPETRLSNYFYQTAPRRSDNKGYSLTQLADGALLGSFDKDGNLTIFRHDKKKKKWVSQAEPEQIYNSTELGTQFKGRLISLDESGQPIPREDRMTDADGNPITDEWLATQPSMQEQLSSFIQKLGPEAILIAYNAEFDTNTLNKWAEKLGIDYTPNGYIDPMAIRKQFTRGQLQANGRDEVTNTLGDAARDYGVDRPGKHNADVDVEILIDVFDRLLDEIPDYDDEFDPKARQEQFEFDQANFQRKMEIFELQSARNKQRNSDGPVNDGGPGDNIEDVAKEKAEQETNKVVDDRIETEESEVTASESVIGGPDKNTAWYLDEENAAPVDVESIDEIQVGDAVKPKGSTKYFEVVSIDEIDDNKMTRGIPEDSDTLTEVVFTIKDMETGEVIVLRGRKGQTIEELLEGPVRRPRSMEGVNAGGAKQIAETVAKRRQKAQTSGKNTGKPNIKPAPESQEDSQTIDEVIDAGASDGSSVSNAQAEKTAEAPKRRGRPKKQVQEEEVELGPDGLPVDEDIETLPVSVAGSVQRTDANGFPLREGDKVIDLKRPERGVGEVSGLQLDKEKNPRGYVFVTFPGEKAQRKSPESLQLMDKEEGIRRKGLQSKFAQKRRDLAAQRAAQGLSTKRTVAKDSPEGIARRINALKPYAINSFSQDHVIKSFVVRASNALKAGHTGDAEKFIEEAERLIRIAKMRERTPEQRRADWIARRKNLLRDEARFTPAMNRAMDIADDLFDAGDIGQAEAQLDVVADMYNRLDDATVTVEQLAGREDRIVDLGLEAEEAEAAELISEEKLLESEELQQQGVEGKTALVDLDAKEARDLLLQIQIDDFPLENREQRIQEVKDAAAAGDFALFEELAERIALARQKHFDAQGKPIEGKKKIDVSSDEGVNVIYQALKAQQQRREREEAANTAREEREKQEAEKSAVGQALEEALKGNEDVAAAEQAIRDAEKEQAAGQRVSQISPELLAEGDVIYPVNGRAGRVIAKRDEGNTFLIALEHEDGTKSAVRVKDTDLIDVEPVESSTLELSPDVPQGPANDDDNLVMRRGLPDDDRDADIFADLEVLDLTDDEKDTAEALVSPPLTSDGNENDFAYMDFTPTDEQLAVLDAVMEGKSVAVTAVAGSGKSSTLRLIAETFKRKSPNKKIVYLAFNSSVQQEADVRMPNNTESRTFDSMAMRGIESTNRFVKEKYNRQKQGKATYYAADSEMISYLGITPQEVSINGEKDNLTPDRVFGLVADAIKNFSYSDDDKLEKKHFSSSLDEVPDEVFAYAERYWDDLMSPYKTTVTTGEDGKLTETPEAGLIKVEMFHIAKIWALSKPNLFSGDSSGLNTESPDIILIDEAQDMNPVFANLLRNQPGQKVYVGDGAQSIYGFRGAVNELDKVEVDAKLGLTKSFRFGPQIAGFANRILTKLSAPMRVLGLGKEGRVYRKPGQDNDVMDDADLDAFLVLENADAFAKSEELLKKGLKVRISEATATRFTELIAGAKWLRRREGSEAPRPSNMSEELMMYSNWQEYEEAVRSKDPRATGISFFFLAQDYLKTYGFKGLDKLEEFISNLSIDDSRLKPAADFADLKPREVPPGKAGKLLRRGNSKYGNQYGDSTFYTTPDNQLMLFMGFPKVYTKNPDDREAALQRALNRRNAMLSRLGWVFDPEASFPGAPVSEGKSTSGAWVRNPGADKKELERLGGPKAVADPTVVTERIEILSRLARVLNGHRETDDKTILVSTVHQVKGLEFNKVKLSDNFAKYLPQLNPQTGKLEMPDPEKMRLFYVAATRAMTELDPGGLSWVPRVTSDDAERYFIPGQEDMKMTRAIPTENSSQEEFVKEVSDVKSKSQEIADQVSAAIIQAIENNDELPWRKTWTTDGVVSMPFSVTTNKPYRGSNVLALWAAAINKGYSDPRWITFKETQSRGGRIKKGEKASYVVNWSPVYKDVTKEDGTVERQVAFMRPRVYAVFNVEQTEGLDLPPVTEREPVPVGEAEALVLERYKNGPKINNTAQDEAFWMPSTDTITMPLREQFNSEEEYLETLFHELVHSTGHKSRLDRSDLADNYSKHKASRAEEELIAEIGAALLAARLGVKIDYMNVAGYAKSWLRALNNDSSMIVTATRRAQAAVDYILGDSEVNLGSAGVSSAEAAEVLERNIGRRLPEAYRGDYGRSGEEIAAEAE